jgi:hypothetical protein
MAHQAPCHSQPEIRNAIYDSGSEYNKGSLTRVGEGKDDRQGGKFSPPGQDGGDGAIPGEPSHVERSTGIKIPQEAGSVSTISRI